MFTVASYIQSMKSLATVRKKYFTVREYLLLFTLFYILIINLIFTRRNKGYLLIFLYYIRQREVAKTIEHNEYKRDGRGPDHSSLVTPYRGAT